MSKIKVRVCPTFDCYQIFEATEKLCPSCGVLYQTPMQKLRAENAAAKALIAEMKCIVFTAAGHYPFDTDNEYLELCGLVARAEELLRD